MYYVMAFISGVIVGGIITFFVVQNNLKRSMELDKRLKDTLGKK